MGKHPDFFENLTLTPNAMVVKGIEGGLSIEGHGTFVFNLEDDDGKVHTIKILNSKYVAGLKYSLLSPQHWVQEANDHYPKRQGTRSTTDDEHCILIWDQGRYRWFVPHNPATNTPTF